MKKFIFMLLGLVLGVAIIGGLYLRKELVRLQIVITMFEPENISENFKSFPSFINTKIVESSTEPKDLARAAALSLPGEFALEDSVVQTQAFLDHTNTDGLLVFQGDSVRYEYYGNGFTESDIHISWYMSKSIIS